MSKAAFLEGQQDALHRLPMAVVKTGHGQYNWLQDESWVCDMAPKSDTWADAYIKGYESIF